MMTESYPLDMDADLADELIVTVYALIFVHWWLLTSAREKTYRPAGSHPASLLPAAASTVRDFVPFYCHCYRRV